MLYIEVLLLAIGLSMDSLAVSVTGGAVLKNNCTAGNIIKIASVLGIFQAGMTVIGYTMGLGFEKYICAFDHWIAFTLLLYLGGKMIYDSAKEEDIVQSPIWYLFRFSPSDPSDLSESRGWLSAMSIHGG